MGATEGATEGPRRGAWVSSPGCSCSEHAERLSAPSHRYTNTRTQVHLHTHPHTHARVHTHAHACVCTHKWEHTHIHTYAHSHIGTRAHISTHTSVIHICVCTLTHTCVCTHIHTHLLTLTHSCTHTCTLLSADAVVFPGGADREKPAAQTHAGRPRTPGIRPPFTPSGSFPASGNFHCRGQMMTPRASFYLENELGQEAPGHLRPPPAPQPAHEAKLVTWTCPPLPAGPPSKGRGNPECHP